MPQFTIRSAIISKNRAEVLFRLTLDNTPDRTELLFRLSTFRPCSRKILIFDAAVYNSLGHNFEEQRGSSVPPNARHYTRQNGTTVPLVNLSAVQQKNPSTIISKNRAEVLFRLTLDNTPDRTEQLFRLSIFRPIHQ